MTRALDRLSGSEFDLVVIGGGVHGAFVAWDSAQRGLRVALVEQGDFAGATSGNSQRIIHGGLRYLQQLDLNRARESARERGILMRIAPHFVRPLPCLLALDRGREVPAPLLAAGLHLYGLLSREHGRSAGPRPALPSPRRISGRDCVELWPDLACIRPGGGLLFYDGYARDAERLVLAVLQSASRAGAHLANYARVVGPLRTGRSSTGVRAVDVLSSRPFDIRARMVVNCGGPWAAHIRGLLAGRDPGLKLVKAIVLATRPVVREPALGVPTRRQPARQHARAARARYLFFTPGRSVSLLGTWYASHDRRPDEFVITADEVAAMVAEVNASYPAAELRPGDVRRVHGGLLPADASAKGGDDPLCARRYRIDADGEDDDRPVVSIIGVKLTTARAVAARAVDYVVERLGVTRAPCRTHEHPLADGEDVLSQDPASARKAAAASGVSEDVAGYILDVYGSAGSGVLQHLRENPRWADPVSPASRVIGAQVVHAARSEMAQKLSDVVYRRTDLGAAGAPDAASLRACASILSSELGWTEARTRDEIAEAEATRLPVPGI
ncbi:MAG TPA: glycerol-3-phosphate dehydrogenase/oxidase [Candidatus Eisenbacteria bacterium]|jgi:glycerol-3-phosphate dehydrogenase